MAKVKNKNASAKFHTSRTRIQSSHLAHSKLRDRQIFDTAKRSVLTIIILSMLVVILTVLLSNFQNPTSIVKRQIEFIANSYYEDYFYPNLVSNSSDQTSFAETMSRYTTSGFAKIPLRQLLLYDGTNHTYATTINTYCDKNSTFIHFYPTPPFQKTDYRVEYTYSCTFD